MQEKDFSSLWRNVKKSIKNKSQEKLFLNSWLDSAELKEVKKEGFSSSFIIETPSELHKQRLFKDFLKPLYSELSYLYKEPFNIILTVKKEKKEKLPFFSPSNLFQKKVQKKPGPSEICFNKRYSFENFEVGPSNELAYSISYSVASNPFKNKINPLFLCGLTGLGKTHLLHSIGGLISKNFPNKKIKFVSAETFLNDFVSHIRRKEMDVFRKKYREGNDVLLVDDIQSISKGEAVQEEFFHTFNSFYQAGKPVVVASDKMPKDLNGLTSRIRTRLEGGVIADIQMPEIETRIAILKRKAKELNFQVSEEISYFIAKISKRSVRELEGNLNKIKFLSELQGKKVSLSLVKNVLASHEALCPLKVQDIQKIVAKHFNISCTELISKSRLKKIVLARQVSIFLIRSFLNKSLSEIGSFFGGRDHTTVLNSIKKVENKIKKDSELQKSLQELKRQIQSINGI